MPKGFEIHPDFTIELVASEPLIIDPIEMQFDENGDTYVMEMPGYPMRDASSRLILLKDENADGVYDKRIVFADDLDVATSFIPYLGGFLVASPPNLIWLKDTNNDGISDKREIIMRGFSNKNLQHNYNGLTYGLDNWIYAANGGNSGKPYFEGLPENGMDLRNGDLRMNLEKKEIIRVGRSSGGFKITFDEWGHMYETHNMVHVSHLVFEDRYTENLPGTPSNALENISDHEEKGTSRIYPIGEQETRVNHPEQSGYFSGSCGITYYGGGSFPKEFDTSIFVADCVLNLIHVDILSKDGASFKTSRKREKVEFLASNDRSFRPVNMTTGPNGSLFVVDIHRDVIEHPEWIPDELEANMDLEAGKDKGRIYRIIPKEKQLPFNKTVLSIDQPRSLVRSLNSKNQWERNTAQRLIVTNNLKHTKPYLIEQFNNSKNPLSRLHSMWTLEGLDELDTDLLKSAIHDESPYIRENALKIAEIRLNDNAILMNDILELTSDDDARVRMQATLSLSTITDSLYQLNAKNIVKVLSDQLSNFENDIWNLRAISNALQNQAYHFIQSRLVYNKNLKSNDLIVIEILAELIGSNSRQEETIDLLQALNVNNISTFSSVKIIEAISRGWATRTELKLDFSLIKEMELALENIEKNDKISLIRTSGILRQLIGLNQSTKIIFLLKKAFLLVLDSNISVDQRLEYLQLIALADFDKRESLLYQLVDNKMPVEIQKQAIEQLKKSNKSTIAPKLLEQWKSLGSEARKGASNILLYKRYNHDLLLSAMENNEVNLAEFNLDLERRRVLLFSTNSNIRKRAKALFSDAGVITRKDAIASMQVALTLKGNSNKGKDIFKRVCSSCHVFGDIGTEVGPGLTEISRKSKEALLYDILDPNAAVDTYYLNHELITKDGNIYLGLIYKETDKEISILMMGGTKKTINKSNIDNLRSLGKSLMLEGLEDSLSQQEMADLLTFLQTSL